jgi:hypothetical protein
VTDSDGLLRHYRMSTLEGWIGFAVASVVLFLWPAAWDPSGRLALLAYIAVFVIVAFLSVPLVEHRRPWPLGPKIESIRRSSAFGYVSTVVVLILVRVIAAVLDLQPFRIATTAYVALCLMWLTFTVSWRPLMYRVYPWLRVGSATATGP